MQETDDSKSSAEPRRWMSNLDALNQSIFDALAERDALWTVLSEPDKIGNKWDVDVFFQRGRDEVEDVLKWANSSGVRVDLGSAFDFGCGVGRLTQALGEHYRQVEGVDSSAQMLEVARKLDRSQGAVNYSLNKSPDLASYPSSHYSCVISLLVLQHIAPPLSLGYIREFYRIVQSGSPVIFGAPARINLRNRLRNQIAVSLPGLEKPLIRLWGTLSGVWNPNARYERLGLAPPVYRLTEEVVTKTVDRSGGRVVSIRRKGSNRLYLTVRQ